MSRRRPSGPVDDDPTSIHDPGADRRASRDTARGHDGAPELQRAIKVISMKTPGPAARAEPVKPREVKLRSLSEMSAPSINLPLGNLAPPRDEQAATRRAPTIVIALGVLAIALAVTAIIVVIAR